MPPESWKPVEIQLGPDLVEIVDLPPLKGKAKTPVTAAKDGMDAYKAAIRLRQIAKYLSVQSFQPARLRLGMLRNLMENRSNKETRLEALTEVEKTIKALEETVQAQMVEINQLVQHLPTVKALPQGNDENIVRAFIAVLKSNGRIK